MATLKHTAAFPNQGHTQPSGPGLTAITTERLFIDAQRRPPSRVGAVTTELLSAVTSRLKFLRF